MAHLISVVSRGSYNMVNIYEIMFTLQFIVALGITLLRIYNIFTRGEYMDLKGSIITFILFLFCYYTGLTVFLHQAETLIYLSLFRFEGSFLVVNLLLLFGELFYYLPNIIKENKGNSKYMIRQFGRRRL